MKKTIKGIFKAFDKVFSVIYGFFDRILITPITKGIMKLMDLLRDNTRGIEKFVSNKQTLIVLSLVFALIIFFLIDRESNLLVDQSTEILYNQPVTAVYNEEAYVVEGLPKTVDIILIGKKYNIYLAKQLPMKSVSVDLMGLKPGSHKVALKYDQSGLSSIQYKLDPSVVYVVIHEKVSATRELSVDVLHRDSLDSKLYIKDVKLNRSDAIIKGSQANIDKVASVKALVDVNNINNPQAGDITLKDVPLAAYDAEGKIVDVEIVPGRVEATVTITAPSKEVPIKITPTGELAFGKSIKSLTSNVSSVLVYGDEDTLAALESIPVEVNIQGVDKDKEFNINLKRPNGVREMSTKTIVVKLELDELVTKEISDIYIETKNLDTSKYKAQAVTQDDNKITVIAKGSSSVIESLDVSGVHAFIDLANYNEPGEYEIDVEVEGSDVRINYTPKVKKVKIRISLK